MTEIEYRVRWEIDVYAKSPKEAAQKAREHQKDEDTEATVFDIYQNGQIVASIDLDDVDPIEEAERLYRERPCFTNRRTYIQAVLDDPDASTDPERLRIALQLLKEHP